MPDLLLQVVSSGGVLSDITFVQRINSLGGGLPGRSLVASLSCVTGPMVSLALACRPDAAQRLLGDRKFCAGGPLPGLCVLQGFSSATAAADTNGLRMQGDYTFLNSSMSG